MRVTTRIPIQITVLMAALACNVAAQEPGPGLKSEGPLTRMFNSERQEVTMIHCDKPYHIVNFEADSATFGEGSRSEFASIVVDLSIRLHADPERFALVVGHSTGDEAPGLSTERANEVKQQLVALSTQLDRAITPRRIAEYGMGLKCYREPARARTVDAYIVPGGWHPEDALKQVCPSAK